jgi:predicted HicB family RNase H-like nuclease
MSDTMEYKGFCGSTSYSDTDSVFHGRLQGIGDLVTYEGTDVQSLKLAFQEAVEDYFATCAANAT